MPAHRLSLHSEQYGKSGNIGENFRKLLGSPSLDPLQTVIRESVQNILDAAKIGNPPEALIRLRILSDEELANLDEGVFNTLPNQETSKSLLSRFLNSPRPQVLEICDFGTTGLGGPTRSDQIPVGTENTDFIDFLRNIGSTRDTNHGGGTYGFGKVSLYAMSRCNTILVDSFVHGNEAQSRRLMACHVGRSFSIECQGYLNRYTGRHWWGEMSPEGDFVEPLTNQQAEETANALGFPQRNKLRSGTSIMILDFDSSTGYGDEEEPDVTGARIVETLLWNFWPRMMHSTPEAKRLSASVEVNGSQLAIPRPEEFPPLDLFTEAMNNIRTPANGNISPINCQRPNKTLGMLSIKKGLRASRKQLVESDTLFPKTSSHIALMRPVELVVKYLPGDPLPDERLEWAGVFVVDNDDEVEQAFADAEPPAHDDWIPDNLPKGHSKTYVNVALRELKKASRDVATQGTGPTHAGEGGPSLAKVSGIIGSILDKGTGDGAGTRSSSTKGKSNKAKCAKVTRPVFIKLLDGYGSFKGAVAMFAAEIIQDHGKTGMTISADAFFTADGGRIEANNDAIEKPEILELRFERSDSSISTYTKNADVSGDSGNLEVYVGMPSESAVTLELHLLGKSEL